MKLCPINLYEVGAIVEGRQYIMAEAKDDGVLHVEVTCFTAGPVVSEAFGDRDVSLYWRIVMSPRDARSPLEKVLRIGHRSGERDGESVFFFDFSTKYLIELDKVLLSIDQVGALYRSVGMSVPERFLRRSDQTPKLPRPCVLADPSS